MDKKDKSRFIALMIAVLTVGATSSTAVAAGLLDIKFGDVPLDLSLTISNPYWPLNPDNVPRTFTYIGETEDECVINQVFVNDNFYGETYALTGAAPYGGLTALQVVDIEWMFEDIEACDLTLLPDNNAITEFTFDWYIPDAQQNIWYVGELSQSFEEPGCGAFPNPGVNPDDNPECFGGSWEAGIAGGEGDELVSGEAGIVVPGDFPLPGKPLGNGTYYMQEVAFEAEDMAKILKQHTRLFVEDGVDPGEYEDCRKVKEWNPFEHGSSVEHKWYCADGDGLVLIEGIGGGPTEQETLIDVNPAL